MGFACLGNHGGCRDDDSSKNDARNGATNHECASQGVQSLFSVAADIAYVNRLFAERTQPGARAPGRRLLSRSNDAPMTQKKSPTSLVGLFTFTSLERL